MDDLMASIEMPRSRRLGRGEVLAAKKTAKNARASRLDLARARLSVPPVDDWRDAAAILETNFPERWSLPEIPSAEMPFDFDGGAEIG